MDLRNAIKLTKSPPQPFQQPTSKMSKPVPSYTIPQKHSFNIELSNYTKRQIGRKMLQEQLSWFYQESIFEILIKLLAFSFILGGLYTLGFLSGNLSIIVSISCFFYLTTNQKFYKQTFLYNWAKVSYFVVMYVMCYYMMIEWMEFYEVKREGSSLAEFVFASYVYVILVVLYLHLPAMEEEIPRQIFSQLQYFIKSLPHVVTGFVHLIPIVALSSGLYILLNIGVGFFFNLNIHLMPLLSIKLLFLSLLTIVLAFLFIHLMYSFDLLTILIYNKKINGVHAIVSLMKLNPYERGNTEIHRKGLEWMVRFSTWNECALKSHPYHSKFYSTYWDLFKDYSQEQLKLTDSQCILMKQKLQELHRLKNKQKTMKDDLFIWIRRLRIYFQLEKLSLECLKCLDAVDLILELYWMVQKQHSLFPKQQVKHLQQKLVSFIQDEEVNQAIRKKLQKHLEKIQYFIR